MNIDWFIDVFHDDIIDQYDTELISIPLSDEDLIDIAHYDAIAEDMARSNLQK
jgi:hypothetical protein